MLASVIVMFVCLVVVGIMLFSIVKFHRESIEAVWIGINSLDESKADRRRGRPVKKIKIPTSPDHVKAPEPWPEPSGEATHA